MEARRQYEAVVIGTSAGGLYALTDLLQPITSQFLLPIIVVQHRSKGQRDLLESVLQSKSRIKIKQADEKEKIVGGTVYIAPPDYHLLIERDRTFGLNADAVVQFSRPSIDVLFESAADVYKDKLIGIVMTGSNSDGAAGIGAIRRVEGVTIAQEPAEAQFPLMPDAAIKTGHVDRIMTLKTISSFLLDIGT